MALPDIFEKFAQQRPLPVMVRGVLEQAFCPDVFDDIFKHISEKQHCRKLLFSTCVSLMTQVVTRVEPTLGAAIRAQESFPVRRDCVYRKIAGLEDDVVAGALAVTAMDLADVVDHVDGARPSLIPGLRTLVADGNHLEAVQHRLKVLRGLEKAALPGTCVALLDADRKLFLRAFLLQDGHSSEMQALSGIAAALQANDLLLVDRNFCSREFAAAIEDRKAFYLMRQHGNRFPLEFVGERVYVADMETGRVYEQQARYKFNEEWRTVRRITIELFKPTRNGETVVNLLSNLPPERVDPVSGQTVPIGAVVLARGYPQRWTVETAFHTLTVDLNCELNTLGYPPAALFGFCVAAMCYNAYSTAIGALRGHFGAERIEKEFSTYYMANDIRKAWDGMEAVINKETWSASFGTMSISELAQWLLATAALVDCHRYRKAPTRPRRPKVKGASKRAKSRHTSVFKELEKQRAKDGKT